MVKKKPADAKQEAGDETVEWVSEKCCKTSMSLMVTISVLGAAAITYGVFFIYLGIYGYNNPDPEHAYFIDGVDKPALTREAALSLASAANVTVRTGYPIDMAHMFRTWFLWGFWASAFSIAFYVSAILLYIFGKKHLSTIKLIGGVVYAMTLCNTAAWFLLGFFWRFSKAGRISAGERIERPAGITDGQALEDFLKSQSDADGYQLNGGKFISVFLWLVIGLFLTGVALSSIIATYMCINTPDVDIDLDDDKPVKPAQQQQKKQKNQQ